MSDRSPEARQRQVRYRHRAVIEWETTDTTGYNGDVEYLVKEAEKTRARFKILVLPLSAEVVDGLSGTHDKAAAKSQRITEVRSTVHVEVDV